MTKKYKSTAHLLSIVVKVDGKNKTIEFVKENLGEGVRGCTYSTNNKSVQKAIEGHEYFGRKLFPFIWTDDIESMPEPEPIEVLDRPKVENKRGRKPKAE